MQRCITDKRYSTQSLSVELVPNGVYGLKNKHWILNLNASDGTPLVKISATTTELVVKFSFAPEDYQPLEALAHHTTVEEAKCLIAALKAIVGLDEETYGRTLAATAKKAPQPVGARRNR